MTTSGDDDEFQVVETREGDEISMEHPLKIGPPRFQATASGMGLLEAIDPIAVDATLNTAVCQDEDCDCEHEPVYLLMIEVEVTREEFERLSLQPGWVDDDPEEDDEDE